MEPAVITHRRLTKNNVEKNSGRVEEARACEKVWCEITMLLLKKESLMATFSMLPKILSS